MPVIIVVCLAMGAAAGAVNGLLVTRLGLPSLAVTIGTLTLYRGLANIVLGPISVSSFPTGLTSVGVNGFLGIPSVSWSVAIFVGLAIATGVMLKMSSLGRSLYAIGLNQEAAFHAGIRVKRIKMSLFVLSGLICSAVGILYAFELSSAAENIGIGFELQVVTIVLLGGVSIFGGKGSILGVALAAIVYGLLRSALLLTSSFNENDFQVVSGGLLILSVLIPNVAAFTRRGREVIDRRRNRGLAATVSAGGRDRCAMAEALRLAAVDLGAESGRVVVGRFDGDVVELEVSHRFENRPLRLPDGLHWNAPGLFAEILHGLAASARAGRLDGIGVDGWGCDYALLDGAGRMLGLPFHYRDERTSPAVITGAHARVDRDELYRRTGIQTMAINTVFQLTAEAAGAAAAVAQRIALIPDLIALWLTGTLANEETNASTTGLLEAHGPCWAIDLIQRLGLPAAPFAGEVTAPGVDLGPVLDFHREAAGLAVGVPVRTVAGHDTASAFVAAPLAGRDGAVLSSGTWSLLGVELAEPELGPEAAALNLTNERGINGTIRLLRNVMGLWLVQECRRAWRAEGTERDYEELHALAREASPDVGLFDPDHHTLLRGGDMPARIGGVLDATGQPTPRSPADCCARFSSRWRASTGG